MEFRLEYLFDDEQHGHLLYSSQQDHPAVSCQTGDSPTIRTATGKRIVRFHHANHTVLVRLVSLWAASILLAPALPAAEPRSQESPGRQWQRLANAGDRLVSRELFWFVDAALADDSHQSEVEQAYAWAEAMQDRDPASPTYGNFRWYRSNPKPIDRNAVEFCMSTATVTWMRYRDRLTPVGRAALERLMRYSVEGLKRHRVAPSYTNIYLEKTWNMIGLGQALNRPDVEAEGSRMLEQWLRFTWQNGITEYLSGTYYGVSFGPLEKIAQHAQDATTRSNADAGLRYLWTDVAANWFAPCARLGGACSREYNFQVGRNSSLLQRLNAVVQNDSSQYLPPPLPEADWQGGKTIIDLIDNVPRLVRQRWGDDPSHTIAHYVSSQFSIGSAAANYGPMDRPMTINIASPRRDRAPFITFLMDARGDPYGIHPFQLPSGHAKARHLSPFLTSVQRGPEVLLVASDDPHRWGSGYKYESMVPTCLQSHLTFPADMEISVGGRIIKQPAGSFTQKLAIDQPIFLRKGDVTIGVRVVWATSGKTTDLPIQLVADTEGRRKGVMRLTCIHEPKRPANSATLALWTAATQTTAPEQLARFRERFAVSAAVRFEKGVLDVRIPGLDGPLQIVADVEHSRTLMRSGVEPLGAALLTVNGVDCGSKALAAAPAIQTQRAELNALLAKADSGRIPSLSLNAVQEAEAAVILESPLKIAPDAAASGRACIVKPKDPAFDHATGRAGWVLHIPRTGHYYLWARLRTPTPQEDSFSFRVIRDIERDQHIMVWHTGVHKEWQWVRIAGAAPIELQQGDALLEIYSRESGAMLDAIGMSDDRSWSPPIVTKAGR